MEAADLYDMVAVERVPAIESSPDVFRGLPAAGPYGRVFGGQLVGQAVSAATEAVERVAPGRTAHSLHASFLSAGDCEAPIDYDVSVVRDGRSFSVRSVRATQGERLLMTATLSFQLPTVGLENEVALPSGYPDPDSLTGGDGELGAPTPSGPRPSHRTSVEIRRVPRALDPMSEKVQAGQAVWLRAAAPRSGVAESVGCAVLAMAADFTVLESAVKGHGLTFASDGLSVASLDHSVWWHAPAALDDWVLYVQENPWSGGERALITGRIYDRAGRLLASMAQEGLLRVAQPAQAGRAP